MPISISINKRRRANAAFNRSSSKQRRFEGTSYYFSVASLVLSILLKSPLSTAWTATIAVQRNTRTSIVSAVRQSTETSFSPSPSAQKEIIHESSFLGDIYRIRLGEDNDFLAANAVPTFASTGTKGNSQSQHPYTKSRGLEGALQQGPAFVLDNVLSPETCEELIHTFETLQFGSFNAGKNNHGALQILVSHETADAVGQILCRHVDIDLVEERRAEMNMATATEDSKTHDVRLVYAGLNRRWRVYRYAPGGEETFAPHIDAGFPPSGLSEDGTDLIWDATSSYVDEAATTNEIVSRLTVLIYLNDDFLGGETKFYQPNTPPTPSSIMASVKPIAGSSLVFPQGVGEGAVEYARQHWPLHEGSPVVSGTPKYVIRSDILFATMKEALPLDSELFQNDHLVRQTFLPSPSSLVANDKFLSHAKSLYNPHMGVEDISYLLYSIIRFTKKRRIVEIGAGYTSLWILQALKDNDDEIERIRQLSQQEQCKLLNIQWANKEELEKFIQTSASLLCIDNCEHQKETATGACAVAKSLGLEPYLQFLKGDAFGMKGILESSSIDILWCDFGVGSRMKEFLASGAWSSLRPGGLLLCHSTLTNQRTRDWLEAARAHKGEETTGMPPNEYTELSLLEPHKYYQNSVSIFQKRGPGNQQFTEPIFSEYA